MVRSDGIEFEASFSLLLDLSHLELEFFFSLSLRFVKNIFFHK